MNLKHFLLLIAVWLAFHTTALAVGHPALPGDHPLTAAQAGDVLLAELRCAACHQNASRGSLPEKAAPDLSAVGARVAPTYLRRFLASPATVHPGTTMPDVLTTRSADERERIATALTHFLVAQSPTPFAGAGSAASDQQPGQTLYHTIGCVACHGPRATARTTPVAKRNDVEDEDEDPLLKAKRAIKPIAIPLGHLPAKYSVKSLSEFLFQPLKVRSGGRMPDLKLTPVEAQSLANYLLTGQTAIEPALVPDPALVQQGREFYRELNCAACHPLSGMQAAPRIAAVRGAELTQGCWSPTHERGPRYQLEATQTQALTAALQAESQPDTDSIALAKTLTAFRCVACHVRDDYGGVPEAYDPFFLGIEPKLGDDGRIPPPLTLLGAKLQPAWLHKVLFDGESVRHYVSTRMPQYGVNNLAALPALVARLDTLPDQPLNLPTAEGRSESERNREKLVRAAGRELLGDKGLNCVACHTFNGKAAPGSPGIDLVTTPQRLQPAWYNRYLRNPGAFRPRTVMPSAWSNGIAAHKTILGGNTDEQIAAIWYYASLGTSAADPAGIRAVSTKLIVDQRPLTHRGRSRVAGFRGIAVGFPEHLNYAFNAETGTLSAIWQGDFLNVNWSGQGSGDFQPASDPITLAQDVSFVSLSDASAPWPLLPVMTKEARTNPNPLYPKNVGYQFGGYALDETFVPTFLYRSGSIAIQDRSVAVKQGDHPRLKRVLTFNAPAAQSVWFRALTGNIHRESERVFRINRLRVTIPSVETKLRPTTSDSQPSELLLHLQLPAGPTTFELEYEPLAK
ncbi:MAG: hypothetical protein JNM18_19525 [Planctomycetaceae bacterium]|nr:hypothetical protein [Planctomycetaceae bacterium]